jgi:hypothetical protein
MNIREFLHGIHRESHAAITPQPGKQPATPTFGGHPEWDKERFGEDNEMIEFGNGDDLYLSNRFGV